MPLQFGKRGQPQKFFPALSPCRAVLLTIGALQSGHNGAKAHGHVLSSIILEMVVLGE